MRPLIGAVAIVAAYLVFASGSSLWDRDEPRFARAAVEMAQSGNWLYPTFNGELRPDKPILIYWLMAPLIAIFGQAEVVVRAWSGIGIAAAALIARALAIRLYGPPAGAWAMMVLATCPLAWVAGTAATVDAMLLAVMSGAVLVGLTLCERPQWWRCLALAALLAAGLLLKGPVGIAVPLVAITAIARWRGRMIVVAPGSVWRIALATAAALIVFLAWAVPANAATHGEYARVGIGRHVLQRAIEPLESHGGKWLLFLPYYGGVLALAFFPWTAFLPGAIARLIGERSARTAILLGWSASVVVLMTCIVTKLPHYILPAFVPLAVVVAGSISGSAARPPDRMARLGMWMMTSVGLSLAIALAVAPWLIPGAAPLRWAATAVALVLAVLVLAAGRHLSAGRPRAAGAILIAGMLVLGAVARFIALPAIERYKPVRLFARAVATSCPGGEIAALGPIEPSLIFYLDATIERLAAADAVESWRRRPGVGVLIIDAQATSLADGAELSEIVRMSGFNYTKGRAMTLVAFRRN